MKNAQIVVLSKILVQYAKMANVDLSVKILVFLAKMVNVRRSAMKKNVKHVNMVCAKQHAKNARKNVVEEEVV